MLGDAHKQIPNDDIPKSQIGLCQPSTTGFFMTLAAHKC